MATIWARSNGNWNGSIWDYFNENTQQTEAYPFASPQINDIVYSNAFEISNVPDTISVAELHNDANDEYGLVDGGYFAHPTNMNGKTLSAKIYCGVNSFILRTIPQNGSGTQLYINGDIHTKNTNCVIAYRVGVNRTHNLIVTGNIYCDPNCCLFSSEYGTYRVTITGNMICENGTAYIYNGSSNNNALTLLTFSGNLTNIIYSTVTQTITSCNGTGEWQILINQAFTTLNILGKLIVKNNAIFYGNNLTINGTIEYENTANQSGIRFSNFNISNPDTFTWKDITEPRTNQFIIVTNYDMNNRQQYPAESDVKKDVPYAYGLLEGTFEPNYPPESVVLDGFEYGENMTGTMTQSVQVGCVTKEDVREGIALIGMGESGTLVVPSADDVREGVIFDNGTIGTLIVQGGGDRLRIADFGYYTNAQSDTYIVDITEADKPKFASAEERILIEMFPELDLNNIPEMYFDELFVKFLKYRLIVEYYRTAGVNSTFTPSEPTTEIVNYRNVTNEVWLNSANIYLNAWNKKYDLNKPPKKVRL